jgi:hypothetical protein
MRAKWLEVKGGDTWDIKARVKSFGSSILNQEFCNAILSRVATVNHSPAFQGWAMINRRYATEDRKMSATS